MNTPLYTALKNLADQETLRLHIPGHKGKAIPFLEDLVRLDFTEISPTGNMYEEGEPFQTAQALWAEKFHFPHCQFLTGGSTQGVYTALGLCGKGGVLLDRNAHRSAVVGCGLLGLDPVYLARPWLSGAEVSGGVTPEEVEKQLTLHPHITTVFVTSPTMYGVLSDIDAIATVVHNHGGKLVVDGAHGAHLPWLDMDHFSSADLVCVSAHKTLPALGQASLLFFQGFTPQEVGETASLFGTSSPSYLITASMDLARDWMEHDQNLKNIAKEVEILRNRFPSLKPPIPLDPLRLCILCHQGDKVAQILEEQGIYLELANRGHLVAVFTALDQPEDIKRFTSALSPLLNLEETLPDLAPPEGFPSVKMSIQEVLSTKKITISLKDSCGKIAGANLAPYPPGVPVVVMGEEISQKELDYFQKIGYDKDEIFVTERTKS